MDGNRPSSKKPKAVFYPDALIAGAIGGVFPNLIRVALDLTAQRPGPIITGPVGYAIGLLVFMILGAGIAWIWQEKRLQKAFYLGIGLPALVQVVGLEKSSKTTDAVSPQFSLVTSAYAVEIAVNNPVSGRRLAITPRSAEADFAVLFFDESGREISATKVPRSEPQVAGVPEAATSFAIRAGSSQSNREALPNTADATMNVVVEIAVRKGSGFLQALGFERSGAYDIRVMTGEPTGSLTPAARAQFLNSIRNVQQKLRDAGVFAKEPDGVFGDDTANAVGAYQKQKELEPDQILGARTLNKLVGESAGRELVAAALQIELALKSKGLLPGQPNGALGPTTISAIRALQRKHNLPADGALGKKTLDAVFADL